LVDEDNLGQSPGNTGSPESHATSEELSAGKKIEQMEER
jgi:hypothetical protein